MIDHFSWGNVVVNGRIYKDVRVWPGHVEAWEWNAHTPPTHHRPGIVVADLADLIDAVDTLILSRGINGALRVTPEALEFICATQKTVVLDTSESAVCIYNELAAKGVRVGMLLHSTC